MEIDIVAHLNMHGERIAFGVGPLGQHMRDVTELVVLGERRIADRFEDALASREIDARVPTGHIRLEGDDQIVAGRLGRCLYADGDDGRNRNPRHEAN